MVRRRQLSAMLRGYRIRLGMSVKEVAERLYESPSKITRIEKGQRTATLRDIRDLCDIYGVSDEVREELMSLARESRERQWWQRADLSPALQNLIGMEGAATSVSEFELMVFPGLLQTQDYADAVVREWLGDADKRRDVVDTRMRRQQIFERPEHPHMRFVLDEAVVHRMVGGPDVMREQVRRVTDLVATAGIEVGVIPFAAGMHMGVTNGFTILEFRSLASIAAEPGVTSVIFIETSDGDKYLDAADDVEYHLGRFDRLSAQALPTDESVRLMRTVVGA